MRCFVLLALCLSIATAADKPEKPLKLRVLKPGYTAFGPKDDIALGLQASQQFEKGMALVDNPALNAYLNRIGSALVSQIKDSPFQFQFKLVNDPEINAFALPGGFIYVHTGLIANAENEAQVAGVLGHEIGHVMLRHGANKISKDLLIKGILAGAAAATSNKAPWVQVIAQLGGSLSAQLTMMKFSRTHEKDADAYGVRLMAGARYNPIEAARFFEKLAAAEGGKHSGGVAGWFTTHPPPDNRAGLIEQEVTLWNGPKDFGGGTGMFHEVRKIIATLPPPPKPQQQQQQIAPAQTGLLSGTAPIATTALYRGNGVTLQHPLNWQAKPGAGGIVIAPPNGVTASGGIGLGLVLGEQAIAGGVDLARDTRRLAESLAQQQQMRQQQAPVERRIDGQSALFTRFSSASPLPGGGEEVDILVTVARTRGVLWYMVLIAPASQFANLEAEFAAIAASLRFTP